MAKKRKPASASAAKTVTASRASRLCRLLKSLARSPQERSALVRKLKVGVRDFYRDLVVLQEVGIEIELAGGRYALMEPISSAIERLPFPDPGLTLGEARQLAKGRSQAHRKLKAQVDRILK